MTGLALLPLETHSLPGWPAPEAPSGLQILFVLLVVPALIAAILIGLVTVSKLAKTNRATSIGVLPERPTDAPEVGGSGASAAITTGAAGPGEVEVTVVNTDIVAEHHVAEQVEAGLVEPRH